jgi:Flp pilus assembly protein TadD
MVTFHAVVRPKEAVPRMKANLKKALEIDPNLGEARALLGIIYANYDWDWQSAEQELKQAVQLNPNSAHVHYINAHSLAISGRHEEAVAEAKLAQKLDPLSPLMNGYLGVAYFYGGQYDNAIEVLQMTQTLNPNWHFSHYWLGFAYHGKSILDKAIAEYEKAVELMGGSPWMVMNLTVAYYQIGKKAQADKLFESLKQRSKQEYVFPMAFCWIHLLRGDLDQAYEWLERACEEGDSLLAWTLAAPREIVFVKFFDEPRFKELLKKYGVIE